jgi:hypothetical protein
VTGARDMKRLPRFARTRSQASQTTAAVAKRITRSPFTGSPRAASPPLGRSMRAVAASPSCP